MKLWSEANWSARRRKVFGEEGSEGLPGYRKYSYIRVGGMQGGRKVQGFKGSEPQEKNLTQRARRTQRTQRRVPQEPTCETGPWGTREKTEERTN